MLFLVFYKNMCDSSNSNNEHVCSCANHNLPTYEEAIGASTPSLEPTEIHTIFTTPKPGTNHDRQSSAVSSQPSIDSARSRNTDNTHQSSYRTYNNYRNPSYNQTRYASAGTTSSNAYDNRTRGYNSDDRTGIGSQKSDTPCGSSVAIAAFFIAVLFIIIFLIMKVYVYLHHSFAIETSSGD